MKGRKHYKYINGCKGVISIFLAALMIPFVSLADILIESSRYHAITSSLDQIMDSASISVLSNFDAYLMERFGLAAVSQQIDIDSTYNTYFTENLGGRGTDTSALGWKNSLCTAEGKYALSDNTVLNNQILEISKYSVVTEFVSDELISAVKNLLSELPGYKSFSSIMTATSDVADAAGSVADMVSAFEDLKEALEYLEEKKNEYDNAYNTFQSATNAYAAALREVNAKSSALSSAKSRQASAEEAVRGSQSAEARIEDDINELKKVIEEAKSNNEDTTELEEQLSELENDLDDEKESRQDKETVKSAEDANVSAAQNELNQARNDANIKRTTANNAIDDYAKKTKALKDQMVATRKKLTTAMTSLTDVVNSGVKAVNSVKSAGSTLEANKLANNKQELIDRRTQRMEELKSYTDPADIEKTQQEIKAIQEQIDQNTRNTTANGDLKTYNSNQAKAIENGVDGVKSAGETVLNSYDETAFSQAVSELENLYKKVDGMSADDIASSFSCSKSEYYVTITGFPSSGEVIDFIDYLSEKCDQNDENSLFAIIEGFSEFLEGFFKINLFYDSKLDAVIDENLLGTEAGSLGEIIDAYLQLKSDMSDLIDNGFKNLIKLFKKIKDICVDVANIIDAILNNIQAFVTGAINAVSQLANNAYDKVMIAQFVNLSLANRTSYSGSNVLTGFSYNSILSKTTNKADDIFLAGAFAALANALDPNSKRSDMFCGAETEYLLAGSRVEVANQTLVFLQIYLIRILTDVFTIMSNAEVETIAASAGAASLGLGEPIVKVLYILIEPFLDTMFIVNGEEISWYKKCIYLTPTGIPILIGHLLELGLTKSQQQSVTDKFAKLCKVDNAAGGKQKDSSIINAEYKDYLFILLLCQDQERTLNRLKNIMYLEGKKYYKTDYDINKTYTFISSETKGEYIPFLSVALIYTNFVFPKDRSQVRGY